jgi:hypothetical protein
VCRDGGPVKQSSTSPISTIRPRYITATRFAVCGRRPDRARQTVRRPAPPSSVQEVMTWRESTRRAPTPVREDEHLGA